MDKAAGLSTNERSALYLLESILGTVCTCTRSFASIVELLSGGQKSERLCEGIYSGEIERCVSGECSVRSSV